MVVISKEVHIVRNPLSKRIPRIFKKDAGKYIGIFLILVSIIALGSSFMAVMDSAKYTLDNNDRDFLLEDGQFETMLPVADSVIAEIESDGIEITDNFYITVNEYDNDTRVLVFDERTKVNLPSVFEGKLPEADDEIALERLFAKNHDIKLGDEICFNNQSFKVTAIIAVPDYNALFKSNQDLVMDVNGFGIAIVSHAGFERFADDVHTYRYSYRFTERSIEKSTEREKTEYIQKSLVKNGSVIQSFLTKDTNQCINLLREDMGKDGPIMQVFIYLLIMVVAFVFAILTANTIEAEASIIGTLRSMGYTKAEVVLHYLSPTIIVALLSSVIGNTLGYTVMIEPFKNMYYGSYSIAPLQLRFNLTAFITTTILPVVIMILINLFMLWQKMSLSPLKFLRKDLSKKRQKRAVKLPDFSFMSRFRLRVLLQNKVNYIILFIGIFISSFLLMFGIGLNPLVDHYVDEVDESLTYEYQYVLKAPVEAYGGEKLTSYSLKTRYEFGNTDMDVSFMGISGDTRYFEGISLPENSDEIVISKPLAQKLGADTGDTLVFKDDYYEKSYSFKVAGVYDYKGSLTAFMKRELLNEALEYDTDYFNSYLSDEKLDIDESMIAKYITRADMIGTIKQLMTSFKGVIHIVNIFSVAIYMILMYILTKTVIEKNALSISFMKVFGYENNEISRLYLRATTITVLVSLVICIPIEALCFKYTMVYISSMVEGYMPFYLPAWVYAALIITGVVAYFVINAFHVRKVKSIPMSEALKNRE